MAQTILKGKIVAIGPITKVGDKQTELQYMILSVAGYVDGFGDKKGKDQQWCLQALGKKVTNLNMTAVLVEKKAEVKCYLDSQYLEPKEAGKEGLYIINATIASFEIIP
jgi:hypothetical protein